jgi:hypothetical protein
VFEYTLRPRSVQKWLTVIIATAVITDRETSFDASRRGLSSLSFDTRDILGIAVPFARRETGIFGATGTAKC